MLMTVTLVHNDRDLGVVLFPLVGLQLMGLLGGGKQGGGRQAESACRNPSSSPTQMTASLALCAKHASMSFCISHIRVIRVVLSIWVPGSLSTSCVVCLQIQLLMMLPVERWSLFLPHWGLGDCGTVQLALTDGMWHE